MNEFSENFAVLLDANVLFGSIPRDLILSLANEGLFRPRWSARILKELEEALKEKEIDIDINYLFAEMTKTFPEAEVSGYGIFLEKCRLGLDDADDDHVLAAALMARASMVVTNNLKHFPKEKLDKFALEAKSADQFIADAIHLSITKSTSALTKMKNRRNISINQMIDGIDNAELPQTTKIVKSLKNEI